MNPDAKKPAFNFADAVIEAVAAQRNQALDTAAMQAGTIAKLQDDLKAAHDMIDKLSRPLDPPAP